MPSSGDKVLVWDDIVPRGPAMQMAVDEMLLMETAGLPVLRHYRWAGRCASFGVFQPLATARAEAPDFDLVRRWTAGGVVRHDLDWTFSIVLPAGCSRGGDRPSEIYCWIHRAVAGTIESLGLHCRLAAASDRRDGPSCFSAPADGDVLGAGGVKLCGGAQRRTRRGVLHQGSLQGVPVGPDFLHALAGRLFENFEPWSPNEEILRSAGLLAETKYSTAGWLERVP